MKKPRRESKWEWYAVKNLFVSQILGEPLKDILDDNNRNDLRMFEESIIVVKAQSFNHAYKLGAKKAKEIEIDYYNPNNQLVSCKYVDSVDCFKLFDNVIASGTEVYSRLIQPIKDNDTNDIIARLYPEYLSDSDTVSEIYYPFRIREFNMKPKS